MWSKPLLCHFQQSGKVPQTQASQGFAAFRLALPRIPPRHSQSKRATNCANPGFLVIEFCARCGQTCGQVVFLTTSTCGGSACIVGVSRDCEHGIFRLEGGASCSQTRRDTNFAIPGYSLFCHDTTESGKNKDFSVCGHLCGQSRFYAVFNDWGKSSKRRCRKALRRFASPYPGYRHGTPKLLNKNFSTFFRRFIDTFGLLRTLFTTLASTVSVCSAPVCSQTYGQKPLSEHPRDRGQKAVFYGLLECCGQVIRYPGLPHCTSVGEGKQALYAGIGSAEFASL